MTDYELSSINHVLHFLLAVESNLAKATILIFWKRRVISDVICAEMSHSQWTTNKHPSHAFYSTSYCVE